MRVLTFFLSLYSAREQDRDKDEENKKGEEKKKGRNIPNLTGRLGIFIYSICFKVFLKGSGSEIKFRCGTG